MYQCIITVSVATSKRLSSVLGVLHLRKRILLAFAWCFKVLLGLNKFQYHFNLPIVLLIKELRVNFSRMMRKPAKTKAQTKRAPDQRLEFSLLISYNPFYFRIKYESELLKMQRKHSKEEYRPDCTVSNTTLQ